LIAFIKNIHMRTRTFGLCVWLSTATLSFGGLCAADEASPSERRYLNEVFDEHVRTGDVVFAERVNNMTGKPEKLTLRVFEPKGDTQAKRPLLVLTPGGGFMQHGDHWMDDFGEQIARAGYVVAIHRYRLSASVNNGEQFHDALFKAFSDQKAAIRYFVKDAQGGNRFRIDPENIFIGGHSAGAITSMYVAYLDPQDSMNEAMKKTMQTYGGIAGVDREQPVPFRIRGVVNLSGMITDLEMVDKEGAPLMSIHGDKDDVVPIGASGGGYGSVPIHQRAESVGLSSELHIIRGGGHNDPGISQVCPECIPLVRRFMFNMMTR
jgi:poly(3-hydroxybutyrate) depolymerase